MTETIPAPVKAKTFPQMVRAAAAAYGDELALTLKGETIPDDAVTFRELDNKSALIARGLLARGAGKGSRIGFIQGNSPMFAVLLAAIARIGAIAVPISTLIKANELVRVLRQSDVTGLIVQRSLLGHDFVARVLDALPELRGSENPDLRLTAAPYLRWIASWGADLPACVEAMEDVPKLAGSVSEDLLQAVEAEVHSTDQMLEIYTSGSMALPKGVKHLHGPVVFRAGYLAKMIGVKRGGQSTAFLPMFWVGGMGISLLPNWISGGCTLCTEGTSTSSRHAMGTVMAEEDLAVMAQSKPFWALGMSETFGPYSYGDELRAPGYPLCAPLDHIAERYEVRIADPETNLPVPDGEPGEIQVRGYALSPGLHKLERDQYYTPDGFYHTGDLGLIEGTRIHFAGRSGDMIKTNGSNVSPAEVEQEMQLLPGIHSAYVVGLPDDQRGELVVAAVVPRDGAMLDMAAIEAELKKRLSSFKVPRAYVQIAREDVPMLPSNKVARRQIETLLLAKLGR
ncbi:MAG: hypothetical protein RLZZ136_1765 [Pseudomonadota bacterium]|jgi:acyl-CoA synthetase (AMP-forming)/AMP-acid ligase II